MTLKILYNLIEKNKIPMSTKIQSDSGWECDPTDMDGVYYNEKEGLIIFTQDDSIKYQKVKNWKKLS